MYTVADVLGGPGAFALGAAQAGFSLVAKRELPPTAPDAELMEANREILGKHWSAQTGGPDSWGPITADVVLSAPGSLADAKTAVRYAATLRPAVLVVALPTRLANAPKTLDALHEYLWDLTRLAYQVTRLDVDNAIVGGVWQRTTRLAVFSQIPFGVEKPELYWTPTVRDAIEDLERLGLTWEPQPMTARPTWWSLPLRSRKLIDGHMPVVWDGRGLTVLPDELFDGDGAASHYATPRALTHREMARLAGYPDDWRIAPARDMPGLGVAWSRTLPVHTARWLMTWVRESLNGSPARMTGERDASGMHYIAV